VRASALNPNSEFELPQKNAKGAKSAAEEQFQRKISDAILHSGSGRLALCSLRSLAAYFGFRLCSLRRDKEKSLRSLRSFAANSFRVFRVFRGFSLK
jgi:hypothetical protein